MRSLSPLSFELEDYLIQQSRNPPVAVEVEGTRVVEILKPTVLAGIEYAGMDPFSRCGQVITVDGSTAKRLHSEGRVRLVSNGNDRASGQWDVFKVENRYAFAPWPSAIGNTGWRDIPQLEKTPYDRCWLPVIERQNGFSGDWSELFFLPFANYQRLILRGAPGWELQTMVINLPPMEYASARERRLIYS